MSSIGIAKQSLYMEGRKGVTRVVKASLYNRNWGPVKSNLEYTIVTEMGFYFFFFF